MVRYFVTFSEGLEDVVQDELNEKLGSVKNTERVPGILLFDYSGDPNNLLALRTVDDVLILAKSFKNIDRYKKSLWEMRKQLKNVNLMKLLFLCRKVRHTSKETTFSVKSGYHGRRDYTAKEITASILRVVKKAHDWKYVEDGFGDLHINIMIRPKIALCGVTLADMPLHVKNRLLTSRGSLKTSVAASLVRLAEVKPSEIVLEPMCGTGTIAIEAKRSGAKVIAGDIDKEVIDVANKNSKDIDFKIWNATDTKQENDSFDKVIVNLPFDKQVPLEKDMLKKFFSEMQRITKPGARLVILSAVDLKPYLPVSIHVEEELSIVNSGVKSTVYVLSSK